MRFNAPLTLSLFGLTTLSSAQSSGSSGILSLLGKIPGAVMNSDGSWDIASTVCEVFKPGNSFGKVLGQAFGSPYAAGGTCQKDTSGGSGPFKAKYTTDPSLPKHTIYAPIQRPPDSEKLPIIIWGNGACFAIGTMFENLLTEIASHGFIIIANGEPTGLAMSSYTDLLTSLDWVRNNAAAKRYGNVDVNNIAFSGQSCGGLEALSASLNTTAQFAMTILFNSGFINAADSKKIKDLKKPVAFFLGGKSDVAYPNGMKDFEALPSNVPALLADVDVGHIGTYYQLGGGKMGKAGIAFMKWKLKGDNSQKSLFCSPSPASALQQSGWNITSKNGIC